MQKSEFTIAKGSDHRGRQLGTLTRYASKLVLEREASRCVMVSTRMDAKFEQLEKDVKNRVDDLESKVHSLQEGLTNVKDLLTIIYQNNQANRDKALMEHSEAQDEIGEGKRRSLRGIESHGMEGTKVVKPRRSRRISGIKSH